MYRKKPDNSRSKLIVRCKKAGTHSLYAEGERKSYSLTFRLKVEADSYLFIGSGIPGIDFDIKTVNKSLATEELVKIERYIRRLSIFDKMSMAGGKIVIPASTLKGTVRSRIELMFEPYNNQIDSCLIITGPPVRRAWRYRKIYGKVEDRRGKESSGFCCIVCDMFGRGGEDGLASKVFFSDAIPEDISVKIVDVIFSRGRARLKVVEPESTFTFSVQCLNILDEQLALLLKGLGILDDVPILMGAYKYRERVYVKNDIQRGWKRFGRVRVSLLKAYKLQVKNGIPIEENLNPKGLSRKAKDILRKFRLRELREDYIIQQLAKR